MDQQHQDGQRERSLWPPTREQVLWTVGIVALLTVVILIGYRYDITLWDWIKLLVVPAVIAGGGLWFNRQQREREIDTARQQREREVEIAERRTQDEALQAYLDQMGQLLLQHNLRESEGSHSEVRTLARARTLAVLPRLNSNRKGTLVRFLFEALLLDKEEWQDPVLILSRADLRGANLYGAILREADFQVADLSGADLRKADLSNATLVEADLSGADLRNATLWETHLYGADLTEADLTGARGFTNEELEQKAKSLKDATMPNGQKYEDWLKDREKRQQDE